MKTVHPRLIPLETPTCENGTIRKPMPNRKANDQLRGRSHLSETEVSRLKATAIRVNHYGFRDATMISTAYRHGLRVAELVDLTWDQIDFDAGKIHVRRVKGSAPSTHMLQGDELRAFRRLRREQEPPSPFVFTSERGSPFTTAGFRKMLARLGVAAGIGFPVNPHALRHGTGFKLANDGVDTRAIQDYLGHKSITNTVRYSRLSPERFKSFKWRD
jgi:integrase